MFLNHLTQRLQQTVQSWIGLGRLTEDNIKETLRTIRIALLEADVALPVITHFLDRIRQEAIGETILKSLSPGQMFTKLVYDELTNLLGSAHVDLNLRAQPPVVLLLAGLQGSGKTTTIAKLAQLLKTQYKKKILLVSTDIYRPAAREQLKTLAQSLSMEYFSSTSEIPTQIVTAAMDSAKKQGIDAILLDTAGRLQMDRDMMDELKTIHQMANPTESLLVVDSMMGQEAANMAKTFKETLPLTGIILTKTDGDARGGAALSMKYLTQIPIKYMGTGQATEDLEPFHPDRIASRILGMGDIISLAEAAERKLDKKKSEQLTQQFLKGRFTLQNLLEQLEEMEKLGGLSSILDKMPGMGGLASMMKSKIEQNGKDFIKMKSVIQSMTQQERSFPALIKGNRKQRIAAGSGNTIQDVNRLLKQFENLERLMKRLSKGGGLMNALQQMQGLSDHSF